MTNPWELDWTGVKTDPGPSASKLPQAPPGVRGKAKTTPQDMKALTEASALAQAERSAAQGYASTERAVKTMGTGPWKAAYLDAITPDGDGGFWDKLGGVVGWLPRMAVKDETMQARDRLRTATAQATLAGTQKLKGTATDKDMAMVRTTGVSPERSVTENLRILKRARLDSRVAEGRAKFTSAWISRYGSMASPAASGVTYEDALSRYERGLMNPKPKALPKAPPSVRRAGGRPIEIDINGNPIR